MKKKYNLALMPTLKPKHFVDIAKKFASISDQYSLGRNSYPHVTLYQFEAEATEVTNIWEETLNTWDQKPIHLEFADISYITFDNIIYWISLLPNHCEILHRNHATIANILKLPVKKNFDPHLTLVSTRNNHYQHEINNIAKNFIPISDTFELSLGESDEMGQFVKIISPAELT